MEKVFSVVIIGMRCFCLGVLLSLFPLTLFSAEEPLVQTATKAYEAAAKPLRAEKPLSYRFSNARLGDVMRLLAEDAGLQFIVLPDSFDSGVLVTFTGKTSPFTALEVLAKDNNLSLSYHNKIWKLSKSDALQAKAEEAPVITKPSSGPKVYLLNGKEITPDWETLNVSPHKR